MDANLGHLLALYSSFIEAFLLLLTYCFGSLGVPFPLIPHTHSLPLSLYQVSAKGITTNLSPPHYLNSTYLMLQYLILEFFIIRVSI